MQTDLGPGVIHDLDLAQLDITDAPIDSDVSSKAASVLRLKFGGQFYPIQHLENSISPHAWGKFDPRPRDHAEMTTIG